MRDRLGAPLAYVPGHRGFAYEDNAYELTGLWLKEEELISLLVSYRMASLIPDSAMKGSMKTFFNQALTLLGTSGRVTMHDLNEKVSVKNIGYSRTGGRTFHQVLDHLLKNRPMRIVYYSPHNNESTDRDILPLHLLHYMGTWHLIAHCALRCELRYFTLSRIGSIRSSNLTPKADVPTASIKNYIRRNFGILMNEKTFEVCLRFSPDIAPWVAEQVWHPKQVTRRDTDGTFCLAFPVADFREIKREILKYGSQVEVLSPQSLREEVRGEIERMRRVYN